MKEKSATPLDITGWAMEQALARRIVQIEELLAPLADPQKIKRLAEFLDRLEAHGG